MTLLELLHMAVTRRASDLHLGVGLPPVLRVDGRLERASSPALDPEHLEGFLREVTTPEQRGQLEASGQVDFSYGVAGLGRFRINVFRQRGTIAFAIRVIPTQVPSPDELGIPPALVTAAFSPKGLILVTGPAGSGKSTTLASLVDTLNRNAELHIITLEDPVEYLHRHRRSVVHQREVGTDTSSFVGGLRAALREDPDVIMIGEMRDLETIATAITAAETGHLVMATLHTIDTAQTVARIVDAFPASQQNQVRVQLAGCLLAVAAQQLIPRADGRGRVAVFELLLCTPAAANLIREGKLHQLGTVLETGSGLGMVTMRQSLTYLRDAGLITEEEYLRRVRALGGGTGSAMGALGGGTGSLGGAVGVLGGSMGAPGGGAGHARLAL
ncbi:MAG: type IV pilus twitching motility protein PilT [Bacillota bacterium]|nr:type IV pilus twitching motility protein PilT [Bacillota bacterium]